MRSSGPGCGRGNVRQRLYVLSGARGLDDQLVSDERPVPDGNIALPSLELNRLEPAPLRAQWHVLIQCGSVFASNAYATPPRRCCASWALSSVG